MKKILLDKNITDRSYGAFEKCNIIDSGIIIKFNMAGGASYCVPIDYFLNWYTEPHYIYENDAWIEWNSSRHKLLNRNNITFVKHKRILSRHAVMVYISNKASYVVAWDTVLMSCEKMYEHFGGLTNMSKSITRHFHNKRKKGCCCTLEK